jgi:hypothetical protein
MIRAVVINILSAASVLATADRSEAKFCTLNSDCTLVGEICGSPNRTGMRECMTVGMPVIPANSSSCPAGKVLKTDVCPLSISKKAPLCGKNSSRTWPLGTVVTDWSVKECDCSWTYSLKDTFKNCTPPPAGSQAAASAGKCSNLKKGAILPITWSNSGYYNAKAACEGSNASKSLCESMCNMAGMTDRGLPTALCCPTQ